MEEKEKDFYNSAISLYESIDTYLQNKKHGFKLFDSNFITEANSETNSEKHISAYDIYIELVKEISVCKSCPLHETRINTVPGKGTISSKLLFIGEAPGEQEDKQGLPFVGLAGKLLDTLLNEYDFTLDKIYITNTVKCRPPNNRNPKPEEIQKCSSFLLRQMQLINPSIIICLGNIASLSIFNKKIFITQIRGKFIKTNRFLNKTILVFPMYHPSYLLRNNTEIDIFKKDLGMLKKYSIENGIM